MKRRDIIKKLEDAGFVIREGGNHTKVYKNGVLITTIPRHNEINPNTARNIARKTGVKL